MIEPWYVTKALLPEYLEKWRKVSLLHWGYDVTKAENEILACGENR